MDNNFGIVSTWFDRGASYVSSAYYEVLSKYGKVFIYSRGNNESKNIEERWKSPNVTWAKQSITTQIPTYIIWSDFKNWVDKNHISTIIFNEQRSWDIILKLLKLNIKIGAYVDYYTKTTQPFFNLYDFLITNTQKHNNVFKDHPQNIFIPWGTNINLFSPEFSKNNEKDVTFFHSCGMSPYRKGTDLLINAFSKIKSQAKLIIHSQIEIKDKDLLRIIESDKRITLITKTIPPPGLFNLGDIYVYPTRLEGIGLTIVEALSCGMPVITTNNSPMNEFVIHGDNGLLVDVEYFRTRSDGYYWKESICNIESLVKHMEFFIINKHEIIKYKERARKNAILKLDWEKNSQPLFESINKTIKLPKSRRLIMKIWLYELSRFPIHFGSAIKRYLKDY